MGGSSVFPTHLCSSISTQVFPATAVHHRLEFSWPCYVMTLGLSRQGRQGCCLRRALHMGQTGREVGPGLGGWPPTVFSASHSYVLCLKTCVTGTRLLLLHLGAHISTHTVLSLLAYQDLLSWGRKVLPLIPHLANGSCEAG